MKPEISNTIDTTLDAAVARLSEQSRHDLGWFLSHEAREGLTAAIQALGPAIVLELALEAAVERVRATWPKRVPAMADQPFHPNYRPLRR